MACRFGGSLLGLCLSSCLQNRENIDQTRAGLVAFLILAIAPQRQKTLHRRTLIYPYFIGVITTVISTHLVEQPT